MTKPTSSAPRVIPSACDMERDLLTDLAWLQSQAGRLCRLEPELLAVTLAALRRAINAERLLGGPVAVTARNKPARSRSKGAT